MRDIRRIIAVVYESHFFRYLVVGGGTFVIDFGILVLLHGHFNLNLAASTSVAYWISILFNFAVNRYWTFDVREKEGLKRHIMAYMVILIVNYLFAVTFVSIVGEHINFIIAKAIAVIVQMIWTYPVYKKLIFTKQPGESEPDPVRNN